MSSPFEEYRKLAQSIEESFSPIKQMTSNIAESAKLSKAHQGLLSNIQSTALDTSRSLHAAQIASATQVSKTSQKLIANLEVPSINSSHFRQATNIVEAAKLSKAHQGLLSNIQSTALDTSRSLHAAQIANATQVSKASQKLIVNLEVPPTNTYKISQELLLNQRNLYRQLNCVPSFNRDLYKWDKLIELSLQRSKPIQLQSITALAAWDSSLTKLAFQIRDVKLFENQPTLATRLLEPSRLYTNFANETILKLEKNENARVFKALQASLHLAETQLLSSTDILSKFITKPEIAESEDEELVTSASSSFLPDVQQEELIEYVDTGEEEEDFLIALSFTNKLSSDVRDVLQLVYQCNEMSKVSIQKEIFKPTNKLLEVFTNFPWIVANDKNTFATVVDYLYFIFYEGAGKDKLRYLNSHGGVLEVCDCDFIWCIKHLRNKWLRHDADHGKQSNIDKSWRELNSKFIWLGINHVPIHNSHFRKLHHRLIQEAKIFLEKIIKNQIENSSK